MFHRTYFLFFFKIYTKICIFPAIDASGPNFGSNALLVQEAGDVGDWYYHWY